MTPAVQRLIDGSWQFSWPVGTPPYSIYLDGELYDTTEDESYTFTDSTYLDDPPELEILDDNELPVSPTFPPYVRLQWRGNQLAAAYEVQRLVGAAWAVQATVAENENGYYSWSSQPLDDGDTHQFRIIAYDVNGNSGTPITFAIEMCRNPAGPAVTTQIVAGDLVIDGS